MSPESTSHHDPELSAMLRGLPSVDVSPPSRERMRRLAHAALGRASDPGSQTLASTYRRCEPVLVGLGAAGYLLWVAVALRAVLG
jgi:hypothetical protein